MTTAPLKTFICYAREDRPALETLMGHLAVFQRNGRVQFWYDREITGGKNWDDEIRFNLKTADIVLLLVSPDFFRSDYIHSVELDEALRADRAGEALVVPVILKKCLWHKDANIARLQALPTEGKPVFDKNYWPDPDDALYNVAEEFDRILEDPATAGRRSRREARVQQEKAEEQQRQMAEAARQKREAEAAEKKRKEEEAARLKDLLPEMVFVKGGTFPMGEKGLAEPVHEVTLLDFEIGKYPVTVAQYMAFVEETKSRYPEWLKKGSKYHVQTGTDNCYKRLGSALQAPDHPIVGVSWDDAKAYCAWVSKKTGKRFRLPTEAEWEFAARGGKQSKGYDYAGGNDLNEVGWYDGNAGGKTHPVGKKKANELGLHDMSGNVWEWCQDAWHDSYHGAPTDSCAWREGGDSSSGVLRGGTWGDDDKFCKVAYRFRDNLEIRPFYYFYPGFRLAEDTGW